MAEELYAVEDERCIAAVEDCADVCDDNDECIEKCLAEKGC